MLTAALRGLGTIEMPAGFGDRTTPVVPAA
jgi:hypothetical protein